MTQNANTKKSIHPGVAAVAGMVVGAAGAAAVAALTHEPTRKKMGKTLQDAKVKITSTVKDLQKSSKPIVKKAQDKMKEMSGTLESEGEDATHEPGRFTHSHAEHSHTRE